MLLCFWKRSEEIGVLLVSVYWKYDFLKLRCSNQVTNNSRCFLVPPSKTEPYSADWCYDHEFMIASPIDYDHGCVPIGWRDHWRHSVTLGYDHGHRDRDHGSHPLSQRPRRHDDEDVVLTSSRHCRREVVTTKSTAFNCRVGRCPCRRWWSGWHGWRPSLDVQRCRLSLSVVIVEIRRLVWGYAITMLMSRRVCLGPLSVLASGYGYSCITSVLAILLRLSRRECPGLLSVTSSLSHGSGNNVIKEIQIQTFCNT